MNAVDASEHFDKPSHAAEQSPSLLTIILDTNPAAWSLLSSTLPLSSAVANLIVFINAHLAANYTNKVAVIASHCDRAQWLYPSPTEQKLPRSVSDKNQAKRPGIGDHHERDSNLSESAKRLKLNGPSSTDTAVKLNLKGSSASTTSGSKYRPFRLVEEELLHNLTLLLSSTTPSAIASSTSTMIAGALTLALSYINRESILLSESLIGTSTAGAEGPGITANPGTGEGATQSLQSRILLISASPSTDLAHQYIPIMNAIFACQRLSIPIDILQLPLPTASSPSSTTKSTAPQADANSTVFLQQAADATHGIFIPAILSPATPQASSTSSSAQTSIPSQSLLTYLLVSLLPSPHTRQTHLLLPTRIDVDFRAACFCHRNVVSIGYVCSVCLSIFCAPLEGGECLTCGTRLSMGEGVGLSPVVAGRRKKTKQAPVGR